MRDEGLSAAVLAAKDFEDLNNTTLLYNTITTAEGRPTVHNFALANLFDDTAAIFRSTIGERKASYRLGSAKTMADSFYYQQLTHQTMSQAQLHDAFGELIYAVALADGHIQAEETAKLKELLENHPWGKDIQWSFDYETRKGRDIREAYDKALQILKDHGPDPEYAFLVELVNAVAEASGGINAAEKAMIDGFQQSLYQHFMDYMEKHDLIGE